MEPWKTDQPSYKTAAAHLTCSLPSVGWISWTDLSIPLYLGKLGNERLWEATTSRWGLSIPLSLFQHTEKHSKIDPLYLESSMLSAATEGCLAPDCKACCYIRRQCCFPMWWKKLALFHIKCCWYTEAAAVLIIYWLAQRRPEQGMTDMTACLRDVWWIFIELSKLGWIT